MADLPHQLDRTVVIGAPRETVFRFFTDEARWASWWGKGSTIDPRPGGNVLLVYPGGVQAAGEVVDIAPPERLVFTYGFVSGNPIPVGSSRVSIALEPIAGQLPEAVPSPDGRTRRTDDFLWLHGEFTSVSRAEAGAMW